MATVHWKMTQETYEQYVKLLNEMALAAKENDRMRYECAHDAFRALPGRPLGIHPDLDRVVPLIERSRIITSGPVSVASRRPH